MSHSAPLRLEALRKCKHTCRSCVWRAGCTKTCPSGSGGVVTRSCGCTCSDWSYGQDRTQCATTGTLPRRAAGAIRRCEALGTTYPHPTRVAGTPVRESRRLPASRRSGARVDGRANSGELPINVVRTSKPKALTGLNQKVSGQAPGFPSSPAVAVEPPANRQSLNHPWYVRGTWKARRPPFGVGPPQGGRRWDGG